MKTQHTPGPWTTDENEIRFGHHYERRVFGPTGSNGGSIVAQLVGDDREANARLIAAAPKLLETLKRVLFSAEMSDDGECAYLEISRECADEMRAAISEATTN